MIPVPDALFAVLTKKYPPPELAAIFGWLKVAKKKRDPKPETFFLCGEPTPGQRRPGNRHGIHDVVILRGDP